MSRAAVQQYEMFGLFPIGDTPRFAAWWQNIDLKAKQKWFCGELGGFDSEAGWNAYLAALGENMKKMYAVADDDKQKATEMFAPAQSDEQIVPIINALVHDVPGVYQVNIPNRGHVIKGFPEDLVIECRGLVDGGGVRGIDEPGLPERLMCGMMYPRHAKAEALIYAVKSGEYDALFSLLMLSERTKSEEQARSFIDEWLNDKRNTYARRRFGIDK